MQRRRFLGVSLLPPFMALMLPVPRAVADALFVTRASMEEPGYEATHYVDVYTAVPGATSDVDITNGRAFADATSPDTPCTLGRALAEAGPGAVVQCNLGVYSGDYGTDTGEPLFQPGTSGNSGNPIIFFARNPAAGNYGIRSICTEVRLSGNPSVNDSRPVLGHSATNPRSFIVWDGFYVDQDFCPPRGDIGPTLFPGNDNKVLQCYVKMTTANGDVYSSNNAAVRLQYSRRVEVADCVIESDTPNRGASGFVIFFCQDLDIHHNTIFGSGTGQMAEAFFTKFMDDTAFGGDMMPSQIHHNYVYGCRRFLQWLRGAEEDPAGQFYDIFQNVISDLEGNLLDWNDGGSPFYSSNFRFVNNTVIRCGDPSLGVCVNNTDGQNVNAFAGAQMYNNLWVDPPAGWWYYNTFNAALGRWYAALDIDYNRYDGTQAGFFTDGAGTDPTHVSLASWQGAGFDVNGSEAPVAFVDKASTGNGNVNGAKLMTPINAGSDILNLKGGGVGGPIHLGAFIEADQSDQIGARV